MRQLHELEQNEATLLKETLNYLVNTLSREEALELIEDKSYLCSTLTYIWKECLKEPTVKIIWSPEEDNCNRFLIYDLLEELADDCLTAFSLKENSEYIKETSFGDQSYTTSWWTVEEADDNGHLHELYQEKLRVATELYNYLNKTYK